MTEAGYDKIRGSEKYTIYEGTTPLVAIYEFKTDTVQTEIYVPLFYGYRALNEPGSDHLHIDRGCKSPGEMLDRFFEDKAFRDAQNTSPNRPARDPDGLLPDKNNPFDWEKYYRESRAKATDKARATKVHREIPNYGDER